MVKKVKKITKGDLKMVEVNILKDNQIDRENILNRNDLIKLSKDELVSKLINLSESKKNQEDFILNISH